MTQENTNEKMNIIGKNVILYRTKNHLTQENLGDLVGCKQQTINSIERGKTKHSKYLPYIAKALNVDIADLDPSLKDDIGPRIPQNIPVSNENEESYQEFDEVADMTNHRSIPTNYFKKISNDIPIFGSKKETNDYFTLTDTPVELLSRPDVVKLEKDAFGLIICTEVMDPLFRLDHIIIVHPRKIPKTRSACLFIGSEHGKTIYTLGEYIQEDSTSWSIRQYNPNIKLSLSKAIWQKCYVIVDHNLD